MFGLGMGELLVIGLVVILFFGGSRLPKLGSSLGQAISNFKKGLNNQSSEENQKQIPENKNS